MKYGMEGYGLYWYCVELIASDISKDKLTFELEHDSEIIAFDTNIHPERVQEMMVYMVKMGLFESENGTITCMKLAKRLDQSMTSSPYLRKLINNLQNENGENALGHDGVMQEEKERRGENTITPLADNASRRMAVNCPHQEILDKWAQIMPEKSQPIPSMWTSKRQDYKNLATRWKEMLNRPKMSGEGVLYDSKESGVEWWGALFNHLRKSEFLMKDENSWFDLGWLLKASNFTKIIEGKYHGKGQ
jgi:hypothetical protein